MFCWERGFKYDYVKKLRYNIKFGFIFLKIRLDHTEDEHITSLYLFNLRIYTFTDDKKKKGEELEKKIEDETKEKAESGKAKSYFHKEILVFIKDNLSKIKELVKGLFDIFKPNHLYIYFLLGTYDPYYNGLISAFHHTIKGSKPGFPVEINIDWTKEVLNSHGEIEGSFIGARIIWEILKFLIGTGLLKKLLIKKFRGEKKWKKQKTS
ncbi:MAG: hypothetical protein ACQEQG_00435 [Bacillota bacterium]